MPYVQVDEDAGGHRLYYRLFPEQLAGEGHAVSSDLQLRPRVALIMGLGGSHLQWQLQVERLEKSCDVCVLDNRGIGFSSAPYEGRDWRWTTACLARDVCRVLDHLAWMENVHIVGISMGGMIAQELALAVPARVASLSLISTYASAIHALPSLAAMVDFGKSLGVLAWTEKEQAAAALRLNFPESWLHDTRPSDLHDGRVVPNERWVRKYGALQAAHVPADLKAQGVSAAPGPAPRRSLLRQLSAVLSHSVSKERGAVLVGHGFPIAVICGDRDALVRPVNSKILARRLDAKVHMLSGCGHGLIQQEPDTVTALLEETIREGEQRCRRSDAAQASSAPRAKL
eukprot:TRINITY_DN81165_c0_g1_i1.p1 TRINITY_DN81165_c0_g1~~TRINITY_DN81165_c0_g1_i1.p1  ORF type:complete len:343 (+),score=56.13 TRINITY_DN81165_c0_g1_i1:105-1133(+)